MAFHADGSSAGGGGGGTQAEAPGLVQVLNQVPVGAPRNAAGNGPQETFLHKVAFDEEHGVLVAVTSTDIVAFKFGDDTLSQIASLPFGKTAVFVEYVPTRKCFIIVDDGVSGNTESTSGGVALIDAQGLRKGQSGCKATIVCVESRAETPPSKASKKKKKRELSAKSGSAGKIIKPRTPAVAGGDFFIRTYLNEQVSQPGQSVTHAAFNHTNGELAIGLSSASAPNPSQANASDAVKAPGGINVFCLRHSKNSKAAPYRLTQRLEITTADVGGGSVCAVAFDEVLGHIIGNVAPGGIVCIWDNEQGILKQSMAGLLQGDYQDGGLFVGYHNSLTLTFPAQESAFDAWTDEFQATVRVGDGVLETPVVAFATATSSLRPVKNKADGAHLHPATVAAPPKPGDDDVVLATLDANENLCCWHVTDHGVRRMASLSLETQRRRNEALSPGAAARQVEHGVTTMCFMRVPASDAGTSEAPSSGFRKGPFDLFIVVASTNSLLLLKLHDPRNGSASSCLQQVATLPTPDGYMHLQAQVSIESKPPLSAGCDRDNEAILYGTIYSPSDGKDPEQAEATMTALASPSGPRGNRVRRPSLRAPSAVARDLSSSSLRVMTVSTHGNLRTSSAVDGSGAGTQQSKLPPHSRIGVATAVAAKAKVTRVLYSEAMGCTLVGWNTGFVDVVSMPQGTRLRTLVPRSGTEASGVLHSVTALAIIPRHGSAVGERLQRAVVLAGLDNGGVHAWSLSSFESDAAESPDRFHNKEVVEIMVWKFPSKQQSASAGQSSDVVASTVVATACADGEVKIWSVEFEDTSVVRPGFSRSKSLRKTSSSVNLRSSGAQSRAPATTRLNRYGSMPSTSASPRSSSLLMASSSNAPKGRLRWTVRAFFRSSAAALKRKKLTAACQLSLTTIALGFSSGVVERWRLPDFQLAPGAKIATLTRPLQSMQLHSGRVTALQSSALEEVTSAARGRRGYQWLLSASNDCTICLSHLVVADGDSHAHGKSGGALQMELQPLQVVLLSEPVYGTLCYVRPTAAVSVAAAAAGTGGVRFIVGLSAHHVLRFPWPAQWRKRGSSFFRYKQAR